VAILWTSEVVYLGGASSTDLVFACFILTAFFLADGCQHSTFDASQEMLQGK
jgi:hypothetical protein